MAKPKVLVMSGYGINCEEETKFAFERAGAEGEIIHINDLIDEHKKLEDYQILAFPGGFSYGDDTGSGMAFANKVRNNLHDELKKFLEGDKLAIEICNGFQIMVNLGLLPALNGHDTPQVALTHNDSARYNCRWVDVEFSGNSPWTSGLGRRSMPIAHGEGRFYAEPGTLMRLKEKGLVAVTYVNGRICDDQRLPANPNGSLEDIAGLINESGKLIGMMPHPERAIEFTQIDGWRLLKRAYENEGKPVPKDGPGLKIFQNGVKYFG